MRQKSRKTKTKDFDLLVGGTYEVDQSNRIEELNKDSYIAIARDGIAYCIKIPRKDKVLLARYYDEKVRRKFFGPQIFAKSIVHLKTKELIPARLDIDIEYTGYEDLITRIVRTYSHQISVRFKKVGRRSPAHLLAHSFGGKQKQKKNKISTVEPICGTAADLHPEFTGIQTRTRSN